uniref:Uncharacterized protein n=1 Tax=Anguilla anguilla TaxID=7936 RepID=A0A0E9QPL1_ANGAN
MNTFHGLLVMLKKAYTAFCLLKASKYFCFISDPDLAPDILNRLKPLGLTVHVCLSA